MLRKLLIGVSAVALSGVAAYSANLPLLSGSQYSEPSQILATVNTLIQSINTGVGGLINAQTAAVSTGTGTAEQVLQTYTLPAGTLSTAGQSVRITCWGTTGANGNNKTRKLYFGGSSISTATEAANAQNWKLDLIVTSLTSTTQAVVGTGLAGTGGVTPISYVATGSDNTANAVVIKCTGTDGTSSAGDITANAMVTELIK